MPAWKVGAVIAKRRGERPALGMEAPLIGRDEELTVLKQTLQRVESEGRPALVTIIGPAGVGKSRLVSELATYTEGLPSFYYWRTGRCLAYGNTSYSAFADAIKAQCEVLEDDPIDVVHAKSRRGRRGAVRRSRARAGDPRARDLGRPCVLAGGALRGLAPLPGTDGGPLSLWYSCWRTSTGPTRGSSTSSSTSPTGPKGPSWSWRSRAPSSSSGARRGAEGSATRSRSTSTRSRPKRTR